MFTSLGIALLTVSSSIVLCIVPIIYCVDKCYTSVDVVPVTVVRHSQQNQIQSLPQNRHEQVPPQNAIEVP